ncbi:hypothetical protein [Companilactobacillus kimchii]|uniref:Integral membrane protein n=2 Tax=Companilactobacillus kimchii TaxID=2801452 RepID=A0ABR5NQV1_9LACO|nr:hypothetical protein [Companilactobacillus kimchii]KAE9562994.1 hypothetical protein ATN91_02230 [Companilactobacillus kimchii]KRK50036.1 hypothetical protein FC97_GL002424 [Companilactobacillus kimchii DSM 13961 = JCM 10707]OWF32077.1 hypothetical protein LKACC12383_02431 [Companilactobacillus kimchii]GEO48092.1 hypothetical protein LKI01_20910 [Companilactobacillus paralimentarius]
MKRITNVFNEGVLDLLANAGVAIPYFFCLTLYNQNKNIFVYALPFLMLYTFRALGMLLTTFITLPASTMLAMSSFFGVIGSLCILGAGNPVFGIIGGILLGLASSWIWPYYLTVRSRGKMDKEFKFNRMHTLSVILTLILLVAVQLIATQTKMLSLSFVLLAFLFFAAMVGGMNITHRLTFYQGIETKQKFRVNSLFSLIVLASLVMLVFIIRYTRLKAVSQTFDLIISIVAIMLFLFLAYYQIDIHKKIFPVSLVAINRGVIMNYVMLYAVFDSTVRFGFNSLMLIYAIYLIGFELGPVVLKKYQSLRYPLLLIGLILSLFNFTYFVGLFLCAIFVGTDNRILNDALYNHPDLDSERAFLIKYQLSCVGNVSQQLVYMTTIYFISYFAKINALGFFNSHVTDGPTNSVLYRVHIFITAIVFIYAAVTFYFAREKE